MSPPQQLFYSMKSSDSKPSKIRLQVFLSRNGVCSRRRAFVLIQGGDVAVNGGVVREPSLPVDPSRDKIHVKGREIKQKSYAYILLNKPRGYVTTKADRFAAKTVFDLLPLRYAHLVPVGRLDKDTQGLLLLTNNGDVTYQLTHPRFNVDKIYAVCIKGKLEITARKRLEGGVVIEGKKTAPARIKSVGYQHNVTEFLMTMHEGRKRQIRLMLAKVGHTVISLKRIQQGPLKLGTLKTGKFRELTKHEIDAICR